MNFGAQLVLVALASCVYPLLQVGEGGCVDGRTAVRPYTPLPRGKCAGRTAVRPYTPHSVGEGLRVRAKLKTAARRPT